MSDTLFDVSQYKSASSNNYRSDWIDATGADPSWNESSLHPASALNVDELATDAAQEWRSCAEFTITLESGQTIQGNFIPCLEGEHRMHQFDFTGPVSTTGFKSHFVLAVEAEEYARPCDYAQAYIQDLVAKYSGQHSSKNKDQLPKQKSAMSYLEPMIEVLPPVMTEAEARKSIAAIKDHAVSIRTLLVDLEERRGFEALGYPNMSACMATEFSQSRPSLVKELKAGKIEKLFLNVPIGTFLESHFRPLSKLKPEYYKPAFDKASTLAGSSPITAKDVSLAVSELLRTDSGIAKKGIVERLKQKNPSPPEFTLGDVVEVKALKRSPLHLFNGMWGTIEHVGSFSYTVRVSIAKDVQQCKESEMVKVDDEYTADIKVVGQRIKRLVELDLEPVDFWILEGLQRSKCFTPRQLLYLERMESDYGLRSEDN